MGSTRKAFEAWISGPPYEREVERFDDKSAWPGNYRALDVDLAWFAWSAAVAAARADERERCAKVCDDVGGVGALMAAQRIRKG